MIRRPPRSTQSRSSAASDVYKREACSSPPVGTTPELPNKSDQRNSVLVHQQHPFVRLACRHAGHLVEYTSDPITGESAVQAGMELPAIQHIPPVVPRSVGDEGDELGIPLPRNIVAQVSIFGARLKQVEDTQYRSIVRTGRYLHIHVTACIHQYLSRRVGRAIVANPPAYRHTSLLGDAVQQFRQKPRPIEGRHDDPYHRHGSILQWLPWRTSIRHARCHLGYLFCFAKSSC